METLTTQEVQDLDRVRMNLAAVLDACIEIKNELVLDMVNTALLDKVCMNLIDYFHKREDCIDIQEGLPYLIKMLSARYREADFNLHYTKEFGCDA